MNLFINVDRNKKLKLLDNVQKKKVNCNEGPCPLIFEEKIFKKLKIKPKINLINATKLGNKSIVYHINPNISPNKLKYDIRTLKNLLIRLI